MEERPAPKKREVSPLLEPAPKKRPARKKREVSPPHTQNPESRPRRPLVIFLGVGGVPHQLDGGGRVRVLDLCHREIQASTQVNSRYLCILAFRSEHFRCAFEQFLVLRSNV